VGPSVGSSVGLSVGGLSVGSSVGQSVGLSVGYLVAGVLVLHHGVVYHDVTVVYHGLYAFVVVSSVAAVVVAPVVTPAIAIPTSLSGGREATWKALSIGIKYFVALLPN